MFQVILALTLNHQEEKPVPTAASLLISLHVLPDSSLKLFVSSVIAWAQVTFYLLIRRLCLSIMASKMKLKILTSFSVAIFLSLLSLWESLRLCLDEMMRESV